jgi:protoporphyrinogen/coproporphyrinogen III oxidase
LPQGLRANSHKQCLSVAVPFDSSPQCNDAPALMTVPHPSANSPTRRIAVVGGGLSGLSAAHRLIELSQAADRPIQLTVFEASERLGGVIGTRVIGDYLVETGADMFITNKPWAVDLCRRLDLTDRLIPTDAAYRRSLVLRQGKPVPVPEGFTLLTPARIGPVLASPIFSPWGKLRMGLEYFVPRKSGEQDESLAAFVRRRFGSEALDRLVQPLVGGIYTSDPEKLSLKATMPRFLEMERQYRSLIRASRRQARQNAEDGKASGARYGLFTAPAGGMMELLSALEQRVRPFASIRLQTPVAAIRKAAEGAATSYELRFHDGSFQAYDAVIIALPLYRAAELISSWETRLAELLQRVEYASTAIVVSGHRLADVEHPLDAFGLVIPAIENRRILAVSIASRKLAGRVPVGRVLLRTFVGGAMQPELFNLSDEEIQQLVREELADIFGVRGEADFSLLARYPRAMPQYHVGHLDLVEQIAKRAAEHQGLELAGSAFAGVGIPDCIHSGEQAAARIWSVGATLAVS